MGVFDLGNNEIAIKDKSNEGIEENPKSNIQPCDDGVIKL